MYERLQAGQPLAEEVGTALDRLLAETVLGAALPARQLAHAISATFIGIELLPHDDGTASADSELFTTLTELARLVDTVLDLGPTATAARRRLTRNQRRA